MPDGLYPSGMLNVVKHTDEDGQVRYTFTDKQGRMLLDRRIDGDFSEELQDKYAYRYVYDGLGRLTEKKLPGCSPIRYVYDAMDRVVFSQDGNDASTGQWKFTAYDALGHEVATGIFPYAGTPPSPVPVWTKNYTSAGTGSGIASTGYSTSYRNGSSYSELLRGLRLSVTSCIYGIP